MRAHADILIKGAMVVTMDSASNVFTDCDIAIKDSKIIQIGLNLDFSAPKIIYGKNKAVLPGLINTHIHAAMSLLRGYADDMKLETWLNDHIFPAEKKFGSPEFIKIGVALAVIEMIKSGTTTFLDMYFFEDIAAQITSKIGIRAFLGEGILDFSSMNRPTPDETLKYTEDFYLKWKDNPLVYTVVAPHTAYSCSPEILSKSKKLAKKLNVPIHIHLCETKSEVTEIKNKYGLDPVKHLKNIGFLTPRLIAAHCVWVDDEDISILAQNQVKVCNCEESNAKLASGTLPFEKMKKAGIVMGIGTDGAASNNNLDMFCEMDSVAKVHKLFDLNPEVADAKTVLKMATIDGARVLQIEDKIGSIEAGKIADLILLDLNKPHLTPTYNIISNIVYSANGSDVDTVIINGKIIMDGRKILTIDETEVLDAANRFVSEKINA